MDPNQPWWYILAIFASSAATFAVREIAPLLYKWVENKTKSDENKEKKQIEQDKYEEEKIRNGYEFVIASQKELGDKLEKERKETITFLTNEMNILRQSERECIKTQEGLKVTTAMQAEDIKELREQIISLKARLDKSDSKRKEELRHEKSPGD